MTAFSKYAYGTVAAEHAKADVSASSTAEVVAAVAGKKIRVLACAFVCGAVATDATFKSGSTAISPIFQNAANAGAVLPPNALGWFETAAGEALNLTTGAGSQTGVLVTYVTI